jgi:predicted CopG family antitoxin
VFKYSLNLFDQTFKTITIKDDVYKRLTLQKGKDDSFSDLFERLLDDHISGIEILKIKRLGRIL